MKLECFLTNLYSIDVMAPFCLEMQKRGYQCHMALDELFWKISFGEQFDIQKAIKKAEKWGIKLRLRLDYDVDIAVTQWRIDWSLFGLYKNLKAHMSYGIMINNKTMFSYNDYRFDIYFVHGDFERDILLQKEIESKRIVKIGFPKLKYQQINYEYQDKNIITYLPTWDEYNSIDIVIDKLSNVNYKIFVKPHPLQSKEDLKKLKKFNLLSKDCTLKSVVEFSDIIVGDLKSGAIFDALYYNPNKPIIPISYKKYISLHNPLYKQFEYVLDEDIEFRVVSSKDKSKLREYCFNEDWKLEKVDKISPTNCLDELDILKERLENNYRYLKGDK